MKRFGKSVVKENRGEIMLESSIILVLVLIILFALFSMCFLFYQQAVMTSVAAELSSSIAKNFKYPSLALNTDEFKIDETAPMKKYRLTISAGKMEELLNDQADARGEDRVSLSSLGFNSSNVEAYCDIEITGIGRAYVKVTVSNNTEFFLSSLLESLGIYDGQGFSAVSYAEITDMTGYASLVNFSNYMAEFFSPVGAVGDIYKTFGEIIDILKN